ncbi:unnamed protein product [Absidia cylindrospora]
MVHSSWDEPISPIDENDKQDMEKQGFAIDRSSPAPHLPPPTVFYHSPSSSPISQKDKEANEAIVFEKHAQRQKLYEEIAKRRQLGGGDATSRGSSFSSGKSSSSSNRSSARYSHVFNVHPFDAPVNPATTAAAPGGGGVYGYTPSSALPTYNDSVTLGDNVVLSPTDMNEQQQQGLLANPEQDSTYRGWGSVAFDINKVQQANDRIDQQRRLNTDDAFEEARSRRSSKRHRKLSLVQQQQQQPQQSQFYSDDEPMSPLETTAEHWAQQHQLQPQQQQQEAYQQYQPQELDSNLEPMHDETTPLNPFDAPSTSPSHPFESTSDTPLQHHHNDSSS